MLKMPLHPNHKEELGVTVLDEPALNQQDKAVTEMLYIQENNVSKQAAPITV